MSALGGASRAALASPALAAALLSSLAFGAVSCGGPDADPRPLSLLDRFEPEPVSAIRVGASWREGVRTLEGEPRTLNLDPGDSPSAGRLELSVAALRPADGSGGPVDVRVEWLPGPEEDARTLLADRLLPADGWVRHSLYLPGAAGGRLELSSIGRSEVAWAQPTLYAETARDLESKSAASERPPNLLLISLDTVRADHLSLYGYPRATTPNLDRFAADAWTFTHADSTSTWTLPSHGTMLTGLLPDRHGLRQVSDTLNEDAVTIAERLRAAGYRTAAITDGGFRDPHWGFSQGFERYDVSAGAAWEPKDAAAIFGNAARWIEDNDWRPFFLFVHSYEAHQPYINRDGFADPFLDPDYDGPFQQRVNVLAAGLRFGPEDRARVRALYDGGIRRLDHHLGIFLRRLARRGLLDETAVLITSDHGEELGEHGGWEHVAGKLFPENVRVPLVLRPPGGLGALGDGSAAHGPSAAADRFPSVPVTTLDIVPTLLDLSGLEPQMEPETSVPLAGRSLLELVAAPEPERTLLLHGLNSIPDQRELRYRLDRGARSLVLDLQRGQAERYDRRLDPRMERPLPAIDEEGRGAGLAARLQSTLAWLRGPGLAVRLPAGLRRVTLPAGLGFRGVGGWSGLEPLPSAESGEATLELAPARPAMLLLDPVEGGGDRELSVTSAEGDESSLRLEAMRDEAAAAFHPLVVDPPESGVLVPPASRHRSRVVEPEGERRKELEALGYL